MKLDHIGIAVRSIEEARGFYERGLGLEALALEDVAGEKVKVLKLNVPPGVHIELIEPLSPDSTVARHLDKRGEGLHHLSYRVADLAAATESMKRKGFEPLWPEPHVGAGGMLVQFFHPRQTHGVLTELSQAAGER